MSFDPKKWGILVVILAVVGGVFGWWAYSSFGTGSFAVTLKNDNDLTRGEVLHYTFDAKDMVSNIADVSGNGNYGIMSFRSTSTAAGRIGQAFNFLTNDTTIQSVNNINLGVVSVALWLKNNGGISGYARTLYIDNFANPNTGWELHGDPGGSYLYPIVDTLVASGGVQGQNPCGATGGGNTILDGQWHFVVLTLGNGNCQLYQDAVLYGSGTYTQGAGFGVAAPLNIGDFGGALVGPMDDVRLYNRILTQREISRLYGLGGAAVGATIKTNQGINGNNGSGEVGHWTFDGKDMVNNVSDVSGTGNNGTTTGFTNGTTTAPGAVGQALDFIGPAGQFVGVAHNSTINFDRTNPFSISAWVKLHGLSSPASQTIVEKIDVPTAYRGFSLDVADGSGNPCGVNANSLCVQFNSDANVNNRIQVGTPTGSLNNDNKWHHVAVAYDGTSVSSGFHFYIDNVLQTNTAFNTLSGPITNTVNMTIGNATPQDCSGCSYLNGSLDDVRIYNRSITPQEVSRLYGLGGAAVAATPKTNQKVNGNNGSGEVGHWTFDGKDMLQNIADISGNGANGTTAATTTAPGIIGQAISMANSAIDIGQNAGINTGTTMSLAFWIKQPPSSIAFNQYIFKENGAGTVGWQVQVDATFNTLYMRVDTSGVSNGVPCNVATNVLDNKWHHVVFILNNGTCVSYKDGVSLGQGPGYTVGGGFGNTHDLQLISNPGSSDFLFFDDMRMYNRVLSSAEVKRLYNLGQ